MGSYHGFAPWIRIMDSYHGFGSWIRIFESWIRIMDSDNCLLGCFAGGNHDII